MLVKGLRLRLNTRHPNEKNKIDNPVDDTLPGLAYTSTGVVYYTLMPA